ncbi:cation diffusion facilitator family transporter [Alteribacillus persepolensis]|uniref:Cation diffusion facilitator family transporter n=1 Tax=Alteribacillus persepolensis TaxID=568899 RepID=A0A1G8GQ95_9BACI|nr:cation diffusion facilitator family transporter [Alteribacillus persepolensis]SDH96527.1 cation diffusion facilitator family transporter [Alteribacillus persepolensis]
MGIIDFLKQGNTSSAVSALGNVVLASIKGFAAAVSGSSAMFATAMHSLADATNQGFVFFGSALAEKEPTKRFPTGFGRIVNLFVLVAVIIVSIMAYETILTGWETFRNPSETTNFWLNVLILAISVLIDGAVLIKAMKEVIKESRSSASGLQIIPTSFKNIEYAAPPTRLVFYEDIIATLGAFLALVFVVLAHFTGYYFLDGIGTLLIGILLVIIALKLGYDNTIGLIGVAAPDKITDRIAQLILDHPQVRDIQAMRILQEGRQYHVEGYVELEKGLSLDKAEDIKKQLRTDILNDPDIDDVTLGVVETDEEKNWKSTNKHEPQPE